LTPALSGFGDLVAAAEAAADAAGAAIRPWYRASRRLDAETKADLSPVTAADRAAEQAVRALLGERFPGHGILGEEAGLIRPDARLRWVLDPIDGTRSFITGRPLFGTLIALMDGDEPVLGVLDQPILGERWVGVRGHATRFRGAYGRAGCRPCTRLAEAELGCTTPAMLAGASGPAFARLQARVLRTTWGGDCYGYGLVALGMLDVVAETDLKVWDWAALVPIVEGAGGRMIGWNGEALRPGGDGRVLAVGDAGLAAEAVTLLADRESNPALP
jgi:histidinol phosphatase-like enzyme (inositol monophosphatase family)